MKGIDLSRAYYEQYGKEMLEKDFPELLPFLAAGLLGSGSECFGYDDEVSRDHDFDPGFCIFIPGEDKVSRKDAFRLERAYHDLPKEFMGLERPDQQPVGGARRGIIRTEDFLMEKTGTPDGCLTLSQWMTVPEQLLLEVTNGELFDVVINCVSIENTEMASILCTKDRGTVYFFSMATSFTKAALGAEGVGKDVTMIMGNGYAKGHAEITLQVLREHEGIRKLFEEMYA